MFRFNSGTSSRIDGLISGFRRQIEALERVGVPMTITKEFREMEGYLAKRIEEIEHNERINVRGFFPVIPMEAMHIYDLMSFVKTDKGAGIVALPSFAIKDETDPHFRPYIALNPSLTRKTFGEKRRFAITQEIISYAIVNGLTEADLIAKASECDGGIVSIRLNENRPELTTVEGKIDGEILSVSKRLII